MAAALSQSRKVQVLLGYPDEEITEHHAGQVDYSTSKIGGNPDWVGGNGVPGSDLTCSNCQNALTLVSQIYAPLENSPYHRTLYVFACLQPTCWNNSKSWKCFRGQSKAISTVTPESIPSEAVSRSTTDWLQDADDWGSDGDEDEDMVEAKMGAMSLSVCSKESSSSDTITLSPIADDPNGNCCSSSGGAAIASDEASAKLEAADGDHDEVVIDTTEDNVVANNSAIPDLFMPHNKANKTGGLFQPLFLAVDEESDVNDHQHHGDLSDHERQLLLEYKAKEAVAQVSDGKGGQGNKTSTDAYEKVAPKHGDISFHKFLSIIQKNPGQVLRYCRDPSYKPMRLSYENSSGLKINCNYCHGPTICEIQLLPTLIPSLKLVSDTQGAAKNEAFAGGASDLEFGNVLVYTCLNSCWSDGENDYRRETVLVEAENI